MLLCHGEIEFRGSLHGSLSPSTWSLNDQSRFQRAHSCELYLKKETLQILGDNKDTLQLVIDGNVLLTITKDMRIFPLPTTLSYEISPQIVTLYSANTCVHLRFQVKETFQLWYENILQHLYTKSDNFLPSSLGKTVAFNTMKLERVMQRNGLVGIDRRTNLDDDYLCLSVFECKCCSLKYSYFLNTTKMSRGTLFQYPEAVHALPAAFPLAAEVTRPADQQHKQQETAPVTSQTMQPSRVSRWQYVVVLLSVLVALWLSSARDELHPPPVQQVRRDSFTVESPVTSVIATPTVHVPVNITVPELPVVELAAPPSILAEVLRSWPSRDPAASVDKPSSPPSSATKKRSDHCADGQRSAAQASVPVEVPFQPVVVTTVKAVVEPKVDAGLEAAPVTRKSPDVRAAAAVIGSTVLAPVLILGGAVRSVAGGSVGAIKTTARVTGRAAKALGSGLGSVAGAAAGVIGTAGGHTVHAVGAVASAIGGGSKAAVSIAGRGVLTAGHAVGRSLNHAIEAVPDAEKLREIVTGAKKSLKVMQNSVIIAMTLMGEEHQRKLGLRPPDDVVENTQPDDNIKSTVESRTLLQ